MQSLTDILIDRYREAVRILDLLDTGEWRSDTEIANMSVHELQAVWEVKRMMDGNGIAQLSKAKGNYEKN